ncbi:hypothetical protein QTG56_25105 (plasmid) [Rossellomorea sp. AcN35-11]|nr:hypothetical protein [Rossellomorea aquimaris]WJV31913.1 hypothetical protein QTG56_25105 [Rossellomorea sp. AcN35-11]
MYYIPDMEDLKPLISLFEEDNESIECRIDQGRLFIESDDRETELMLRFNLITKSLVVARILFQHKRKGNGEKLIGILQDYGREHDFVRIEFESIVSEEAYRFLVKNGFHRREDTALPGHPYIGNWIRPISETDPLHL